MNKELIEFLNKQIALEEKLFTKASAEKWEASALQARSRAAAFQMVLNFVRTL